jgi:integrase
LARDFGPLALKTVREELIKSGVCRDVVNRRVRYIVRCFAWGTEHELVGPQVHQALRTVMPLKQGRSSARETEPIAPVPQHFVDAIETCVSKQIWAMIRLQLLTGARPGEICALRTMDLEMTGPLWIYRPKTHKTAHRGRTRQIFIGPRGQEALRPWLKTDLTAFIFSPRAAEESRRGTRFQHPGRAPRTPGEHYTTSSYRHAIWYGCDKAGVPRWSPNRLRHTCATRLRKEIGIDATRAVLGHSDADTTTIYAARDEALVAEAMARFG